MEEPKEPKEPNPRALSDPRRKEPNIAHQSKELEIIFKLAVFGLGEFLESRCILGCFWSIFGMFLETRLSGEQQLELLRRECHSIPPIKP